MALQSSKSSFSTAMRQTAAREPTGWLVAVFNTGAAALQWQSLGRAAICRQPAGDR